MVALKAEDVGSVIPPADDFKPGHLFWMPAGSTWLNKDKRRPFVMVAPCGDSRVATLAYGSTQRTEMHFGGACIAADPVRTGLHRNRLPATTYFYPGTLLPARCQVLPPHAGFLGRSLEELRRMLRVALGVGQGSCRAPGSPPGSRRGRIVVLNPVLARDVRTRFVVLLTEQGYSVETNYHIILPIYRSAMHPAGTHDLLVAGREWLDVLPTPTNNALIPIPAAHSVWYPNAIERETEYVLDEDSLAEIDRRLCAYFSLPHGPTGE